MVPHRDLAILSAVRIELQRLAICYKTCPPNVFAVYSAEPSRKADLRVFHCKQIRALRG